MAMTPARLFLNLNLAFIGLVLVLSFIPGIYKPAPTPEDLAYYNGRKLEFSVRVCEEADRSLQNRRLTACFSGTIDGRAVSGRVLIRTPLYPEYDYGDYLAVSGKLQAPPEMDGFDYGAYLARYHIGSVMYEPKIKAAAGPALSFSERAYLRLLDLKRRLAGAMEAGLPEPEAGLAEALLLGYKRTVDDADMDVFARVGLSHMIAISGSHITIMSAMLVNLLLAAGWKRRNAWRLVFVFLIIYPLMTGLSASAVRSAIMGGLVFLALYYGRSASLARTLVLSASVMLAFNFRLLRADAGFQLSFAALLGLIYVYPRVEDWAEKVFRFSRMPVRRRRIWKPIIETANLTLVSQLAILPIALMDFSQLSLIAPLANILVLWTFPFLLSALISALIPALLFPEAAPLFFFPAHLLLAYIFAVSRWLAAPAWAALTIR